MSPPIVRRFLRGRSRGRDARTCLFRLYVSTLVRTLTWKVALAVGVMVSLGLTEGVGLLMLVPLLQLAGLDVQQGATGWIARLVSAAFTTFGVRPTLSTVLGFYVLVISLHGLLSRWQAGLNLALEHEFVAYLRTRLYRAIANANWVFFSRARSADFTHVLTAEAERVGTATYCFLHSCALVVVTVIHLLLALKLSVVLTGLVLASGAGLMLVVRGKARAAELAGQEISLAMNGLYTAVLEHLGGMKIAKSYGAEDHHADVFRRQTEGVWRMHVRAIRTQAQAKYWLDVGSVVLLSVVFYVSAGTLAVPTAQLLLLLFLFARVMPRVSGILQNCQNFASLLPAFGSVTEAQARCEAAAEPRPARTEKIELRQAIWLDRVSFTYGEVPVIRGLSLTIRAGQTTALVGPSGSGKSTVADLIMGLLTPDEGRVLVDGVPLTRERMRSWRDRIGYVAQDTFLFHATVRANLLWARPDATDEAVRDALRLAAAEEFVARLPKGLDTVVGDRGVLLSGGERQRLALARALLRHPSLLILDEATSALDSENERTILQALGGLRGRVAILIISHRPSMVREADRVYVLEEGRVAEAARWQAHEVA